MKKKLYFIYFSLTALVFTGSGCQRSSNNVWDQTSSAQQSQNGRSLWQQESEFSFAKLEENLFNPSSEDFIPLKDEDLKPQFADGAIPQPKNSPGERGSPIPGIEKFYEPSSAVATAFRSIYFNTDDHIVRGKEYLAALDSTAKYLKEHPNTYVFVEGHCDERGPEAYNLSLGARRANYVRTMLVKKGVNPNQIHTISYGKEKPAIIGHNPDVWSKNRRAQFKIYQKGGA